ncbi:hypothetical protein [Nocardia noduli]|uniref:hypothetical protein n=1 Tax=Nocardia noduli TaxID=2815722 RepID=UPI001C22BF30|nr:hypothetical protein [Nocardia noduli]
MLRDFEGDYRLSNELLEAATVPQLRNRWCSIHAKGWALDPVIATLTQGRRYRHAMGFEIGERVRCTRDTEANTEARTGVYPLVE